MGDSKDGSDCSSTTRRKRRRHGERKRSHKRRKRTNEDRRRDKRKRRRDRKDRDDDDGRRKKRRNHHRKTSDDDSWSGREGNKEDSSTFSDHRDGISQALCCLLEDRPVFCTELPIILIRLVGGATFDLRQMTDVTAADRLEQLFESLHSFGVQRQTNNHWTFHNPSKQKGLDEMTLLRLLRRVIDESGVTLSSVEDYERKTEAQECTTLAEATKVPIEDIVQPVKMATAALLEEFKKKDSTLGQQLVVLCKSILDGECLCIDGLPNEELKAKLASIFLLSGLEKSQMNDSDSDDDESRGEIMIGYCLPEEMGDTVKLKLNALMDTCKQSCEKPRRKLVGPLRPQHSSDVDEGPQPLGASHHPSVRPIRGVPASFSRDDGDFEVEKREEWMLVPGENDFLSSIKAGQSTKSRGFKNEKPPVEQFQDDVQPDVRREIDNIKAIHNEARGPSLMSQHLGRKQEEKDNKAAQGKEKWKWSRDSDLDSGRRVDKNALKMILGGAGSDLKSKFHGT